MKSKIIALWITGTLVACLASFFIGRYYSWYVPPTEKELDHYLAQIKPLLADHESLTKNHLMLVVEVLKALDADQETRAKQELIECLGRYYYNYTHEGERYMNTPATESLLKTMESLAGSSESFARVVKFKPVDQE